MIRLSGSVKLRCALSLRVPGLRPQRGWSSSSRAGGLTQTEQSPKFPGRFTSRGAHQDQKNPVDAYLCPLSFPYLCDVTSLTLTSPNSCNYSKRPIITVLFHPHSVWRHGFLDQFVAQTPTICPVHPIKSIKYRFLRKKCCINVNKSYSGSRVITQ